MRKPKSSPERDSAHHEEVHRGDPIGMIVVSGKQQAALHATLAAVQTWQGVASCSAAARPDGTLTQR
jgi:hypothetical protein